MLRRDFTKSNKVYFKNNKIILISVAVFLLVGVVLFALLGLNGNFEIAGYNEFSVVVTESRAKEVSKYQTDIATIVNSYDAKFDNIRVYGEGDDTKFVVRYLHDLNDVEIFEVNKLVAEKLGVDVSNVSEHVNVAPIVNSTDYIYTTAAILILMVIVSIFAYARYNGASALTIIFANLLGTLSLLSFSTILRLVVGSSYLALLVILNLLIDYFAINIFESMHKSSWLTSRDFSSAIGSAVKSSKFRMVAITVGLMLIGVVFVLFVPSAIKYVMLNLMFMAVVLLAVGLYAIPFFWSALITKCKLRDYKIKTTKIETQKNK